MKKIIMFCLTLGMSLSLLAAPVRISIVRTNGNGSSGQPQVPGVSIDAYYDSWEEVITFIPQIYSGTLYVTITDSSGNDIAAAMYYVVPLTEYEFDTSGLSSGTYTITFTLESGTEFEGTFSI